MPQNQTSVRKVMTIRISRDLPLGNFERLDILCTWIEQPSETIWISRELPFFNFEHFDILCSRIGISCESYTHWNLQSASVFNFEGLDIWCTLIQIWVKIYSHLNYSIASVVQFWVSKYIMGIDHTFKSKVMTVWICQELPCSISRVSI